MVPRLALPPAIPLTSHTIVVPLGRQKEAVNLCVCPSETFAVEGEIESDAEHVIVTVALPDLDESAALVAVTVTVAGDGRAIGAV